PSGSPRPPVLPIVLCNGEKSWWAKTSLDALIEPDLPEQLRRWQPQIHYLLLDEQRLADTGPSVAGRRVIGISI
ncbi:MAG TPA: transposase, partial [Thiocapsa sp.]|nr:transposase [Thiocapsa sp.]